MADNKTDPMLIVIKAGFSNVRHIAFDDPDKAELILFSLYNLVERFGYQNEIADEVVPEFRKVEEKNESTAEGKLKNVLD